MPRLKVFCTTSGFYDHVVAAPSRPAALKAWGARTDLFSMGVAKQVTDPKIEKKALERPGEVIRLKRSGEEAPAPKRTPKRKAKPPSRAKLSAAERKLAVARRIAVLAHRGHRRRRRRLRPQGRLAESAWQRPCSPTTSASARSTASWARTRSC